MKKKKKQTHRIWQAGLAFALLLLLCGCTKKEELLLLDGDNAADLAEEQSAFQKSVGEGTVPEEAGNESETTGEDRTGAMSPAADSVQADVSTVQPGVIYVHVCGAVENPGVYELEAGSRVYEAVQCAGGFAEQADQNYVNQAQALEDGVKLVIPTREEAAAAENAAIQEKTSGMEKAQDSAEKEIGIVGGTFPDGQGAGADGDKGASADGRININTASEAQLCEIPGVGATRAAAIAAYREAHGAFEKPEDIMKVSGIKEGMYEKIKDSISVK